MKKTLIISLCAVVFGVISFFTITSVIAEQSGSSPNSGVASRLVTLVNDLITKGYGSVAAGSWGNWGDMWNRIYNAATWTQADATYNLNASLIPAEVPAGQTFYNGTNRTLQTGTFVDYSSFDKQQYCMYENSPLPNCTTVQVASVPASTWTNTNSTAFSIVWKDNRTGLYWTEDKTPTKTNAFTQISFGTCDYFKQTNVPRSAYAGGDADCSDAINYCATLSQKTHTTGVAKTNWYLPSYAELRQAYYDDMYNKAGTTVAGANAFTTTNLYWSSSEVSSITTQAWELRFSDGAGYGVTKTLLRGVRCVSRD
jgi:hypothetical protein